MNVTLRSSITAIPSILFCFLISDFFLFVEVDFFLIGVDRIGLKRVLLGEIDVVRSPSGRSSIEFVLSSSIRMIRLFISLIFDDFVDFFRLVELGFNGNFKRIEFDFNL